MSQTDSYQIRFSNVDLYWLEQNNGIVLVHLLMSWVLRGIKIGNVIFII